MIDFDNRSNRRNRFSEKLYYIAGSMQIFLIQPSQNYLSMSFYLTCLYYCVFYNLMHVYVEFQLL